jgi:hypothetical protein
LHLRDNPEVVAGIMASVEPIRDELFETARKEGRQEPMEAYAADALAELTRRADRSSSDGKPSRRVRSSPGSTCRRCCAALRSARRFASSSATGRWPPRRSAI